MAETLEDIMVDNATSEPTKEEASETTSQSEEVETQELTETDKVETEEAETKDEAEEETEESDKSEDAPWTKAAYLDEKRKRQERDKQLEELNKRLAELDGKQEDKPDVEMPDVIEDPNGYTKAMQDQFQSNLLKQKIEMSQMMMRQMHDDYDDIEAHFVDLVKENPSLGQQMSQSANPAQFAYNHAKQHLEFKDFKSGDLKKKMEAEIRKELEQEITEKQSEKVSKTANLSKSLVNEGSADSDAPTAIKNVDQILD